MDASLIAPFIAKAALYCRDSIFFQVKMNYLVDCKLNHHNLKLYITKREERDIVRFSFCDRLIVLITFVSLLLICFEKFIFSSSNRLKCFWVDFLFTGRLLKKTGGWLMIFNFKITSWACLEASGLNDFFHWYAHWEIFEKSSLSLFEEFKWFLTTEK